jgi:hypothetical protein
MPPAKFEKKIKVSCSVCNFANSEAAPCNKHKRKENADEISTNSNKKHRRCGGGRGVQSVTA